ncbi:MAG: hypothetical protein ACLP4R_05410 [Solirubrobacteraceae bacterium]
MSFFGPQQQSGSVRAQARQERLREAAAAREAVKRAHLDDDGDLPRPSLPRRILARLRGHRQG